MKSINQIKQIIERLNLPTSETDNFYKLVDEFEKIHIATKSHFTEGLIPLDKEKLLILYDLSEKISKESKRLSDILIPEVENANSLEVLYQILLRYVSISTHASSNSKGYNIVFLFEKRHNKSNKTKHELSQQVSFLSNESIGELRDYLMLVIRRYLKAFAVGDEDQHEKELYNLLLTIVLHKSSSDDYAVMSRIHKIYFDFNSYLKSKEVKKVFKTKFDLKFSHENYEYHGIKDITLSVDCEVFLVFKFSSHHIEITNRFLDEKLEKKIKLNIDYFWYRFRKELGADYIGIDDDSVTTDRDVTSIFIDSFIKDDQFIPKRIERPWKPWHGCRNYLKKPDFINFTLRKYSEGFFMTLIYGHKHDNIYKYI